MAANPPIDKGNVVYVSFFLLGVGTLFAWNAIITAASYFGSRFCGTDHEKSFEDDVGSAYNAANLFMLIIVVRYQNLFTRQFRVLGSFIAWFLLFLCVTAMVLFKDLSIDVIYYFTVVACMLCGIFNAICSGGIFGMVAQFPPIYVQAVMSGQGLSGLTAALVSLAAALVAKDNDECDDDDDVVVSDDDEDCSNYKHIDFGSFSYFVVACGIFLLCIVCYVILERTEFSKFYNHETSLKSSSPRSSSFLIKKNIQKAQIDENVNKIKSLKIEENSESFSIPYTPLNGDMKTDNESSNTNPLHKEANYQTSKPNDTQLLKDNILKMNFDNNKTNENGLNIIENSMTESTLQPENNLKHNPSQEKIEHVITESTTTTTSTHDFIRIFKIIKYEVFNVWFIFMITLCVYPGIISEIRPYELKNCSKGNGIFSEESFTAILFLTFSLFDLLGRSLAGFVQCILKENLIKFVLLRIGIVPLLIMCNIDNGRFSFVLFQYTIWPICFMIFLAFTSGYFSTLSMMYAPQRVLLEQQLQQNMFLKNYDLKKNVNNIQINLKDDNDDHQRNLIFSEAGASVSDGWSEEERNQCMERPNNHNSADVANNDAEIAGSIMILALTAGLFSGAMLAYLVAFVAIR